MVKHNRRWLQQSGLGDRLCIVHRVLKAARQLPCGPWLTAALDFRLRCVACSYRDGVAATARRFGRSRATIDRWRARSNPNDPRSLAPRSRRPKQVRRAASTAVQEQAVLTLREAHSRSGKDKLHHLLAQQDIHRSTSMIGRTQRSTRQRNLRIEPRSVKVRQPRPHRLSAIRLPKTKRQPTQPGELIQLDTMHRCPEPGIKRH